MSKRICTHYLLQYIADQDNNFEFTISHIIFKRKYFMCFGGTKSTDAPLLMCSAKVIANTPQSYALFCCGKFSTV